MDVPEPNDRERDLALWVVGQDEAARVRYARILAHYREELLRPFDDMLQDYHAIGDARVTTDLTRIIETLRGVP